MKKNNEKQEHNPETNEPLRCGLVMPISSIDGLSELHWEEVRHIIREALEDTSFTIELVSHATDIGIIHKRIVQNLYRNEIIICDVSAKNPNVMFELGMRLAFDKPAIIIKDDKTPYIFDTSSIEHLQYPRDLHYHGIQEFKAKLKDKVLATYKASQRPDYTTFLKHFGEFVVAKLDEKQVDRDQYVLEALADLRSEVRAIGKRSYPSAREFTNLDVPQITREIQPREYKFVSDYWKRLPAQEKLASQDTQSDIFHLMAAEYQQKFQPQLPRGLRSIDSVTERLKLIMDTLSNSWDKSRD